jgi:hypothetical protein
MSGPRPVVPHEPGVTRTAALPSLQRGLVMRSSRVAAPVRLASDGPLLALLRRSPALAVARWTTSRLTGVRTRPLFVLALAVLIAAGNAFPNGGTLRLANVPAGPFLLSVWTGSARVGSVDVSVAVMRPTDRTAVVDAAVALIARRIDAAGAPVDARASLGGGGNLLLYHADLAVRAPGRWQVTVTAESTAGTGSAMFEVAVSRRLVWPWLLLTAAGLGFAAWATRRRLRPESGEFRGN